MRRKIMIPMLIVAILSFGMVGMAQANMATWIFAPGPTSVDLGTAAYTFYDTTSGASVPLPVIGVQVTNLPPSPIAIGDSWDPGALTRENLYEKYTSGDISETGLGFTNTTAHEIQVNNFIELDTAGVKAAGYSAMTLGIGSMQADEGFYLWGSNNLAGPLTLLYTALGLPDVQSVDIPDFGKYQYFAVSATPPGVSGASDVLILNGAQAVPIPGAVFLLGSGLVGLVGYGRSRKYLKS